jgi:uncharacterized membrane protein
VSFQSRVRLQGWEAFGFAASSACQAVLIVIGLLFVLNESPRGAVVLLLAWCGVGSVYAVSVLVVLGISARTDASRIQATGGWVTGPAAQVLVGVGAVLSSVVGAGAAFQLVLQRADPVYGLPTVVVGIWAMLLSWALLQWGFAQLYFIAFYRTAATVRFPETRRPRLADFAYFAFTIGTTFATSDVEVLTTRMRWRVMIHGVLSFFFNGLIIVFAFTTVFDPTG